MRTLITAFLLSAMCTVTVSAMTPASEPPEQESVQPSWSQVVLDWLAFVVSPASSQPDTKEDFEEPPPPPEALALQDPGTGDTEIGPRVGPDG